MSVFTREECDRRIAEVMKQINQKTDLSVIKNFENQFQVDGYRAFLKETNRKYLIERSSKVILKLGGLISAVSGAIAVILEIVLV